jgi:dinuclear metal center YbgI/SA1388 family protein
MVQRQEIDAYLRELLSVDRFKDYGPNGLQVEGRASVGRIICGVTASLAFIDQAIAAGADALLVHHGLFWRGQDGRLTGWLRARVARLLAADVSLFAYHLPLDAHPELGNNAQLGQRLGLVPEGTFGDQQLGFTGTFLAPMTVFDFRQRVETVLGRAPVWVPGDDRPLRRIAWCTGGAQGYLEAAVAAGADAYLTGEISEPQAHLARETGVTFLACGHHATERYGVQAVGSNLASRFGIDVAFIDVDNPA